MTRLLIPFLFVLASSAHAVHADELAPPPTEGIWWSSEAPGTGIAFNIDTQGRWFAAIYLYDADGEPTFLTMQGDAIEYLDSTNTDVTQPAPAYAKASSPLIRSEGGQCLSCPWSEATAAATDDEATITFYGRNHAEFEVGDWSLRIRPMLDTVEVSPELPEFWVRERFTAHDLYTVIIDTGGMKTVATAKLLPEAAPGFPTPYSSFILECVDCRTNGDGTVSTPEQEDLIGGPYYLQSFRMVCDNDALTNCRADDRIEDAEFKLSAFYIDQTGEEITLVDHGDGEERAPGRIILRAMPEGWQPELP